ncbi:MAG: alpha/beta hydrolase [Spirochaetaceae bacterium]
MINYNFENNNQKQTIVFVHGFTQNLAIFNKQIEFFRDSFNCLTLDLRGHGNSEHDGPFGIEEYTEDIIELLKYLIIDDFIYWGTHTSTAIGLNLYLKKVFSIRLFIFEGVVIPGFNKNINRARSIIFEKGIDEAINNWFTHSEWFEYMRRNPKIYAT